MIIGLGTDIIDNRRIKDTIKKFGSKFKKRCFTQHEIERSEKKFDEANSFSKRYAAKEACAKALGTGLARGVFWKDIEVKNNKYGKPYLCLHNNAKNFLCFTMKFYKWFTILIISNLNIFPIYSSS